MKKIFTLSQADWDGLAKLSKEARDTPVMALSTADALAGRDFASLARQRVMDRWDELGKKYGFKPNGLRPIDEAARKIEAEPTNEATPNKEDPK